MLQIIQRLIDSDFHISGKANLSEWANFRSENSVSGWSSIGGQTTHVLDSKYNPCGSSSGSAIDELLLDWLILRLEPRQMDLFLAHHLLMALSLSLQWV